MATRPELVYSIKELVKDHTDDSLLSNRHILFMFNTSRAKYLRQLYSDVSKKLDDSSIQTFCLDMEVVSRGTCGVTVPCTIVRSKIKLPDLLSLRGRSALISAGPALVGAEGFDLIDAADANACMEDEFATTSVFMDDGYIYAVGNTPATQLLSCLRIKAVMADADSLEGFKNCCGCDVDDTASECISDETPYPIPAHLIPLIQNEVLQSVLQTIPLEASRDTDNDGVPGDREGMQRQRRRR